MMRLEDAEQLRKLVGVEIDSDNGLFSGIILGFPASISVRTATEGHGYFVTDANYSIVSFGTKKLINEKLGKKFL